MKILPLFFLSVLLAFFSGCRPKVSDPVPKESVDSLPVVDTVVTEKDSVPPPPKAADGLFDDFIYSFMKSKSFQLKRTDFPLTYVKDGRKTDILKKEWRHERLYSREDLYLVILSGRNQKAVEKDTALKHVVIEQINLDEGRTKHFVFNKHRGEWRLTALAEHRLSEDRNSDFLTFYKKFSASPDFQLHHVAPTFTFKTYDSDNFQDLEGTLDREQWLDFRPDLPSGTITNINYGQDYANSRQRIVMFCSPSGGMGSTLTFVKQGEEWMLTVLDN